VHIRRAGGFTLVELLVVIVVIGILATIAIATFGRMRERAMITAVTSDLRALANEQEIHHDKNQSYANDVSLLTNLTITDGVNIIINEASGSGWAATGFHDGLAGEQCGIFYGTASAANASPATVAGSVFC
jgi:prepilin-type N-terminal cleavage/methylation domain-containing protein